MAAKHEIFLGISEGHVDPAVAIVVDGKLEACAEEERFTRNKHAPGSYPIRALRYCMSHVGADIADVAAVGVNWAIDAYTNGRIQEFYKHVNRVHPPDPATERWQADTLRRYRREVIEDHHQRQWRREFGGGVRLPSVVGFPHHLVH